MIRKLKNEVKKYDKIIVYGAGKVGEAIIIWLLREFASMHIVSVISDRVEGKTICGGMKVGCVYDLKETDKNELIIIAALEKFHGTMSYVVHELGFKNVYKITEELYNCIVRSNISLLDYCKLKVQNLPRKIWIWLLKRVALQETIIFRTHTSEIEGSCDTVYRYMKETGLADKYNVVWMVNTPEKYQKEKNNHYIDVKKNNTFRNLFYLVTSKYLIWENDPILKHRLNQKSIHITHGMPTIKNVHGLINIPEETDAVLISSENVIDLQAYQMCMDKRKYVVAGLPRLDDMFLSDDLNEKIEIDLEKTIIWMPTFRKLNYSARTDGQVSTETGLPLLKNQEDFFVLNEALKKKNQYLLLKIHPLQDMSNIEVKTLSNICIMTNEMLQEKQINLYHLLGKTKALITDYSSVSFDYLLLNRPIAYVVDDMDSYNRGFALDNIFEFMPGNKIYSLDDLIVFFDQLAEGEDNYQEEREKLRNYCHKYQDSRNAERFCEMFLTKKS